MTLEEIQELINSNQLDLRKLDNQRLSILDGLQKKGELQTRPIGDIIQDQTRVADELAKQKGYEEDPIRAKTGDILNRDTVQAVFDIGAFGAQLLMDRTRLAKIVANPTKYAGLISKLKPESFSKAGNQQFASSLKNLDRITGLDPSKPVGAILRPVIAGTLGYTGGGQAYDIADEIIRAKEGIETQGYKGKDVESNPFIRAADDFAVGLAFSAGAELLAPMAFGANRLARQFFGLDGNYAKTIKALAERQGAQVSFVEMSDPNSIGGRVIQGYNKVFGQLPFIGRPAEASKRERVAMFAINMEKALGFKPNMHLAELASVSDEVATSMKKNYENFKQLADGEYDLFKNMSKQFGDPMIIPMNHQRKLYNAIVADNFAPIEFKMTIDNELMQLPIGRFRAAYENLLKSNRQISPNEFLEMQVLLNEATSRSPKNAKMIGAYKDLRLAMEKDFASINLDPTAEVFLKYSPPNKAIADQILDISQPVKTTIGQISGAGGAKLNPEAISRLKQQLIDANNFYQTNIISFETNLANKLRSSFDKNLFSEKQIAGFFESGSFNADQLASKLSQNIFMSSANAQSFDALTNLQKLLQADIYKVNPKTGNLDFIKPGSPTGNASMKRLFSAYLSDAYQKSFIQRFDSEDFLQSLIGKERTLQSERIPARTISQLKLSNGEEVSKFLRGNLDFDPDTFRKLVLPSEEYIKKFEMVYGPKQGKEMVNELEDMMGYITAINKIETPSSSTYLARRLVLGGTQASIVGASFFGFGFAPTIGLLALGYLTNRFMLSPKRMKEVNSLFKTYLEAADKGEELTGPALTRSITKIINTLSNDYPGDPRVFRGKDITTQNLLEKLRQEKYAPDDLKGLHMDPREKERLFPTVPKNLYSQVLPPPEIDDLFRPIGGAPANQDEERLMADAVRRAPAGSLQNALPRLPGIPMPPLQPQAVTPQRYAAAFPTDTLGILAAQGRKENV